MFKKSLALLLAIALIAPSFIPATVFAASATVSSFKGDIKIYKSGGAKEFKPYNGMALAGGDTIKTGANSSLSIKSGSKSTTVGANSKVTVDSLWDSGDAKGASITVVEGTVLNKVGDTLNVNSKDQVKTSNTVAGVRGTEYILSYKRGEPVKVKMLEGTVNLSDLAGAYNSGYGGGELNKSTVFLSTDKSFINDLTGKGIPVNPARNELKIANTDREILKVLADDPLAEQKYPDIFNEIKDALGENDDVGELSDALTAIEEQGKLVLEMSMDVMVRNPVSGDTGSSNSGGSGESGGDNDDSDDYVPPNSTRTYTLLTAPDVRYIYGDDFADWNISGGECVITDSTRKLDGVFSWKDENSKLEAGPHDVYLTFTPKDSRYEPTDFLVNITVEKRPVPSVNAVLTAGKKYDGLTTISPSSVSISGLAFSGLLPGDELTLIIGSAEFVSAAAGSGIDFICGDLSLGGAQASNYYLVETELSGKGTITDGSGTGTGGSLDGEGEVYISPIEPTATAYIDLGGLGYTEDNFKGVSYCYDSFSVDGDTLKVEYSFTGVGITGNHTDYIDIYTDGSYSGSLTIDVTRATGSSYDPIRVTDENVLRFNEYLKESAANRSKYYVQAEDIALSSPWMPPCDPTVDYSNGPYFSGVYDGDGHTISNLYFEQTDDTEFWGFFGGVDASGEVKGLTVIASGTYSGSSGKRVGAIAGDNRGTIVNCSSDVAFSVAGSNTYVGGIAGSNVGTILQCQSTGSVSGECAGGIAGSNLRTISGCYADANVSGSKYIGGIAGVIAPLTFIENCVVGSSCSVIGEDDGVYVGGIVGYHEGSVSRCLAFGSSVKITASGGSIGRISGHSANPGILDCYANANMDVNGSPSLANDGTSYEGAALSVNDLTAAFLESLGFSSSVWNYSETVGMIPVLK